MKAITIFYSGDPVNVQVATAIMTAMTPILAEGHSQPEVRSFTEDDICKMIVKSHHENVEKSTEDGDNAVKVIMGMIPTSMLDNRLKITVALTRQLYASESGNSEKDKAFCRAMSLIAQGSPISSTVKQQYHFTKTIQEVVTEVYNSYIRM